MKKIEIKNKSKGIVRINSQGPLDTIILKSGKKVAVDDGSAYKSYEKNVLILFNLGLLEINELEEKQEEVKKEVKKEEPKKKEDKENGEALKIREEIKELQAKYKKADDQDAKNKIREEVKELKKNLANIK